VSCLHCLSASLHVKARYDRWHLLLSKFQTPFGITACESQGMLHAVCRLSRFKRLSASLHVKGDSAVVSLPSHQSFKRLSASLHVKGIDPRAVHVSLHSFKRLSASLHVKEQFKEYLKQAHTVSNAFRHHCM